MGEYNLWQMLQYFFPDFEGNIDDDFHPQTGAWGDFNFSEWASDFSRYIPTAPDWELTDRLLKKGSVGDLQNLYNQVGSDINKLTQLNAMSDFSAVSPVAGNIINKYAADKALSDFNFQSKRLKNRQAYETDVYTSVSNLLATGAFDEETLGDYTPDWAGEDYEFGEGCSECPEGFTPCAGNSVNPCGCYDSNYEESYDSFCNN